MKKPSYTDEQLIDRLWDKENVIQIMHRHDYYQSSGLYELELNTLWVRQPEHQATASVGYNNGYYVGMDEIFRHYSSSCKNQPSVGYAEFHTTASPMVVIADDGMSARYLGYHYAFVSTPTSAETADTFFEIGLMFADFLKEDGEWKLYHLVTERDHTIEAGKNYADLPVRRSESVDPLDERSADPTIARTVYEPFFGWEYLWSDMPKPYATYSAKDSYGPDGDLGKPYYERERRVF